MHRTTVFFSNIVCDLVPDWCLVHIWTGTFAKTSWSWRKDFSDVLSSLFNMKMRSTCLKAAATASSTLISLAVARLAATSCAYSSSSSGALIGQLAAVTSCFHDYYRRPTGNETE